MYGDISTRGETFSTISKKTIRPSEIPPSVFVHHICSRFQPSVENTETINDLNGEAVRSKD